MVNQASAVVASRQRFASGRLLTAAGTGAAFAASMTVIGGSLKSELSGNALILLGAAIPLFLVHFTATMPGHENRHHVSVAMRFFPVLGIICLFLGLAMLFEHGQLGAGLVFGVVSLLGVGVCVQSEDRARRDFTSSNENGPSDAVKPEE